MKKLIQTVAVLTAFVAGTALLSNSANATSIPVSNNSFEAGFSYEIPGQGENELIGCGTDCVYNIGNSNGVPGWSYGGYAGNVQITNLAAAGNPVNYIPNGIAFASELPNSILYQTVGATTVAGDIYTLSVYVGFPNPSFGVDSTPPGATAVAELEFGGSLVTGPGYTPGNPFGEMNGPTYLGGTYSSAATGTSPTVGNWSLWTVSDLATVSGLPITIALTSPYGGNIFDDVQLSYSASATPLPASWTMMLAGLGGFGFLVYRRRKNGFVGVAAV